MSEQKQHTTWIDELEKVMACGVTGAILTFNTSDRVMGPEEGAVPLHLKYWLARRFRQEGRQVGYYSLSTGFQVMTDPGGEQQPDKAFRGVPSGREDVSSVLTQLTGVLRDPSHSVVVLLDYFGHLAPASAAGTSSAMAQEQLVLLEILHGWSLDDAIRHAGNFVVMIDHQNSFHSLIEHQGGFRSIRIGLPDAPARERFVHFLSTRPGRGSQRMGGPVDGFPVEELVHLANGLRLVDIEELFRRSGVTGSGIERRHVREKKKQAIEDLCGGLLEVVEPGEGFGAVAGCSHAKAYFRAIKPLWERGLGSLPQAVLLSGVPGSGKSFLIKAIAREFDCPCLVMRGVREMWVGQSERNLDRVLEVVDSQAPCLLWTDEIDQTIGGERAAGPSGDSGTNGRMLGRLLEFFGDARTRGRVLWIATTNRPDLLDVAIRDRFTTKIPFLHPGRNEKEALFPVLAAQVDRVLAPDVDCRRFAAREELELLTVRALQEVIVWAGILADREQGMAGAAITATSLEQAIANYKPTFDPLEHELIGLLSLRMTGYNGLLPWMDISGVFDAGSADWPAYVDPFVSRETGRIDVRKMEERIRELRGMEGTV